MARDEEAAYRLEAGRRLAEFRMKKGATQTALAHACGITQSEVSAIERGARGMSAAVRARAASFLGINPAELDPINPRDMLNAHAVSEGRSKLPAKPPGLEGFLERHPDLSPRLRWYLENSHFRAEPWVVFDDAFWSSMVTFWERYLREREGTGVGGTKGGHAPRKG